MKPGKELEKLAGNLRHIVDVGMEEFDKDPLRVKIPIEGAKVLRAVLRDIHEIENGSTINATLELRTLRQLNGETETDEQPSSAK